MTCPVIHRLFAAVSRPDKKTIPGTPELTATLFKDFHGKKDALSDTNNMRPD